MNHEARLSALAAKVADHGLAGAVISERRALFYFTGTAQPCNLVVIPGRDPVLFARRALDWVRDEAHGVEAREGGSYRELAGLVPGHGGERAIGLELDALPARLAQSATAALGSPPVVNVSPLVYELRMVKDDDEVAAIRRACAMFESAHEVLLDRIRPGVAEYELSAEIGRALRLAGHEGIVFYRRWDAWLQPDGIVASGPNLSRISGHVMSVTGVGMSSALPWGASRRRLEAGDCVYVDLGLNLAGYHGDVARTYVVGRPTAEQKRLYAAVRTCFDETLTAIRAGRPSDELYRIARDVIAAEGLAGFFQGYPPQQGEYIGHALGLELDEPPTLWERESVPLQRGMVLAIEPKIISPDFGAFGVEETVVVTDGGAQVLGNVEPILFEAG